MKEIEVKAYLRDKIKVLTKIESLGYVFSEPVKQIDTVYARTVGSVEEYLKNDHFVRIREKSDGEYIFTVKVPKVIKENLVKREYETKINNIVELEQSLFVMGYKIANKVVKIRRTAKREDFEICMDSVEDLGDFIEIEKMFSDEKIDGDAVLKELQNFLVSFGIDLSDEVKKGYDILMLEKIYNK